MTLGHVNDPDVMGVVRELWNAGRDAWEIAEYLGTCKPDKVREVLYRVGVSFEEARDRDNRPRHSLQCKVCERTFAPRRAERGAARRHFCGATCKAAYLARLARERRADGPKKESPSERFGRLLRQAREEHEEWARRERIRKQIRESE